MRDILKELQTDDVDGMIRNALSVAEQATKRAEQLNLGPLSEAKAAFITGACAAFSAQLKAVAITDATDKLVACLNKISQQ